MPTHATALFGDRHSAHAAVEQLVQAGFPRDAISVVMSESTYEREFTDAATDESGARPARPSGGVLGTIVASLAALPAPNGLPLRAAGPLVGPLLRGSERASRVEPSGTFSADAVDGLSYPQVRFLTDGIVTGSIVVGVEASSDRLRLASQLLELSGGAAQQAA